MKSKLIILKGFISGLLYVVFDLLIIYTQYILGFSFESALVLGILFGIFIALLSYSSTAKQMALSMLIELFSAFVMEIILSTLGIPYEILMYIFRDNEVIQGIGHLTVNELIGYNWGKLLLFWPGLLLTFVIAIILVPILFWVKNRNCKVNK